MLWIMEESFEAEISPEGEAGLLTCFKICKKNPGHHSFIPIREFNKCHLPSRYRCKDMEDMVRALADITVRVSHTYISPDRPATYLDSEMPFPFYNYRGQRRQVTGTGLITNVKKYTEKESMQCPCEACKILSTSRVVWGYVQIYTVSHVVFDQIEASHTTCHIFDTNINKDCVIKLTKMKISFSDVKKDFCILGTTTHDVGLVAMLEEKLHQFYSLQFKVHDKYNSVNLKRHPCTTYLTPGLATTVTFGPGSTKLVSLEHQSIGVSFPEDSSDLESRHRRSTTELYPDKIWITLEDFNLGHLPELYRDSDVLDFIQAQAALTVKMSVSTISEDRPGSMGRNNSTGSGLVTEVVRFTENDSTQCRCKECEHSSSPQKIWAQITVETTPGVVYNQEEADHCTCKFFYDESNCTTELSFSAMRMYTFFLDLEPCKRLLVYATHNMNLIQKTESLLRHKMNLYKKIQCKFITTTGSILHVPGSIDLNNRLAVIVSHPHGRGKYVTVGVWTLRKVTENRKDGAEITEYVYTTPTCPGSSGAPVFTFQNFLDLWCHPHSKGQNGNINRTAICTNVHVHVMTTEF